MRNLSEVVGSRVTLSPLLPEHVNTAYVSWLNDPETARYTEARYFRYDEPAVRRYVEDAVASDSAAIWRILADGRHVGNLRLSGINRRHKRAEMAILVGEGRRKGIGSEAIALATDYAFRSLGLEKLTAGIYAGNEASCRAFEKAGYRCDAVLRRHAVFEGRRIDVMQWVRFAEDANT